MQYEKYPVETSADVQTFEFLSEGPKGQIIKVVKYAETNFKDYYNLGFGDKDAETGIINDLTITNNNDSYKVLATVAAILYVFTNKNHEAFIIATGSTKPRTRLYRIWISNNINEISKDFFIYGLANKGWEKFRKNENYTAFLVKRKF